MPKSSRELIDEFLDLFNDTEDSAIYPLYHPDLVWQEMPSGRVGNRDAFFEALRAARREIANMHLEPISITAGEDNGVLESLLTARWRSSGKALIGRVLWFFTFKDGLICRETEYAIALPEATVDAGKDVSMTELWSQSPAK